jgi:guanine nucleotide-binding protein G(i) subunit alpha
MKIIHQNGYTKEERQHFKSIVFHNVIESMANILRGMHSLNINFSNANSKIESEHFIYFANKNQILDELNKDVCYTIKMLWEDTDVKRCFSRSSEYELGDSAK